MNPSALTAIFLFRIIGRLEIAVLVEIVARLLLVFAHVDLEFFSGLASLPLVVRVSHTEIAFRKSK